MQHRFIGCSGRLVVMKVLDDDADDIIAVSIYSMSTTVLVTAWMR